MLKITWSPRSRRVRVLKLEGELREAWVDVVREACAEPDPRSRRVHLDPAAVTYVDAAGAQLLRGLIDEGVEIAACSSFVAELLHLEDC